MAFGFFRLLPIDAASAIGGWILQTLGPLARVDAIAQRNIAAALPGLGAAGRRAVCRGMWNNMGRVIGEYAHLRRIAEAPARVEVVDPDNLYARAVAAGKGALVLSAHFGGWELFSLPASRAGGKQFDIYRAANNPLVDSLLKRARLQMARGGLIAKGPGSMRETVARLREGHCVGMVVDQKTNEGIPVAFFGRDAMTTRTPAALAYRFDCPIFVALVERTRGARFRIVVHAVEVVRSGDRGRDIAQTTQAINALIESAIRAKPEQWMWVHRRWPD